MGDLMELIKKLSILYLRGCYYGKSSYLSPKFIGFS